MITFYYSSTYSQSFNIKDFLDLDENKNNGSQIIKDAEALMISINLRMIEKKQIYEYTILKECNKGNYMPNDCQWQCTNNSGYKNSNDKFSFKYKQSIPHPNYIERKYNTSNFVRNYNSVEKKASTWVELRRYKSIRNNNCKNEFVIDEQGFIIDFQFSNKSEFEFLKRGILDVAKYNYTPDSYYSDYPPVNYIYEKNDRTIRFTLLEGDDVADIVIKYSCSNCTALD